MSRVTPSQGTGMISRRMSRGVAPVGSNMFPLLRCAVGLPSRGQDLVDECGVLLEGLVLVLHAVALGALALDIVGDGLVRHKPHTDRAQPRAVTLGGVLDVDLGEGAVHRL